MLSDEIRSALFSREEMRAKADGDRVHFRCPRHDDKEPSAWLGGGAWGCFRCNFQESISTLAAELGVERKANGQQKSHTEATFDYTDEGGELLYQVQRKIPKDFIQRRPLPGGKWDYKTKGVRRVPYHLPELIEAVSLGKTIYIVEGEKHVDRLRKDGFIATTNSGGAGRWDPNFSDFLAGADVIILPDNDEKGREHAKSVSQSLQGKAARVRLLQLPGLPPKGDVLDWLAAGHSSNELERLASQAEDAGLLSVPYGVRAILEAPEPEERFIVQGLFPADANILIAGYPKSHKTNTLLELMISAASATPFLGSFSILRQHRCAAVLMEDRLHRVRRRLKRICKAHSVDLIDLDDRMHFWFKPALKLSNKEVMAELGGYVEKLELDLLIVDSWSYVSTGNSNSSDEVTPQLDALTQLRSRYSGLSVLLVHHARKSILGNDVDAERLTDVVRNSSSFGAWYDVGVVLARADESSPVKVRAEMRDLPAPDPFAFTVEDEFPGDRAAGKYPSGWMKLAVSNLSPAMLDQHSRAERLRPQLIDILRITPGISKRSLRTFIKADDHSVEEAFDALCEEGIAYFLPPGKRGQAGRCYLKERTPAGEIPDDKLTDYEDEFDQLRLNGQLV